MINDSLDNIRVLRPSGFSGIVVPITSYLPGTTPQTAGNFTTPFFIADRNYELIEVFERHETAGSDAGTVTVQLVKVPSGTAPGSGTNMLSSGINLKATANTNQKGVLATAIASIRLDRGDALSLASSGTLTALVGVTVTAVLKAT